jgi:hypothetical protein
MNWIAWFRALGLAALAALPWPSAAAPAAAQDHPFSPVAAGLPAPDGEPAGLLLGLRRGDTYSSLFLSVADGRVEARRYPWLVSPQADGFRYLDAASASLGPGCPGETCAYAITDVWVGRTPEAGEGLADFLRRELEAHRADAAADPHHDSYSYVMTRRIEWVANGAVCLSLDLWGYLGGAHGFAGGGESCYPIDPSENSWDMSAPLPVEASGVEPAALAAAGNRLVADIQAGRFEEGRYTETDVEYLATQNLQSVAFRLARAEGRTIAAMVGYVDAPYALSPTYRLTVSTPMGPAGRPAAPYNPSAPYYDRLLAIDDGVRDAFLSPSGNALFVLAGDVLTALEPGSGRVLHREELAADAVVAADWAVGDHAARWRDAIAAP